MTCDVSPVAMFCKTTLWLIRKVGPDDTFNYFLENCKILLKKKEGKAEQILPNIKSFILLKTAEYSRKNIEEEMLKKEGKSCDWEKYQI